MRWPVLGLLVVFTTDHFVLLGQEGAAGLEFNRLANHRRPTRPDPAQEKQVHIELGVDGLDAARTGSSPLGPSSPNSSRKPDRWQVLLDPGCHPFCISTLV